MKGRCRQVTRSVSSTILICVSVETVPLRERDYRLNDARPITRLCIHIRHDRLRGKQYYS